MHVNDPCYPHIHKALDTALITQLFQNHLFARKQWGGETAVIVESCSIKNKRHKPGKSFVLSYHLRLLDTQTGTRNEQVIGARLCKTGQGQQELQEERDKHFRNTGTASQVIYLPEIEVLLWIFPQDRKLIHLAQILDVGFLKRHLTEMLPMLGCEPVAQIYDVHTDVLQYLPERSCMIRYLLTVKNPNNASSEHKIIYGKNYRDECGAESFSIMQQLFPQLPKCAIPLSYDSQLRTLWQSHLPGIPLEWQDLEANTALELLKNIAVYLAVFQDCQIQTAGYYGVKEIDEQLFDTVKAAKTKDKKLAIQVANLVNHLLSIRKELPWPTDIVFPLHQDLKFGNILINDNSVCLIDLDTVCLGDPLADIGSLITNFYRNGLHAGRDVAYVDTIVDLFLHHYEGSVTWEVDRKRLNWFIAAAFVHEVVRRILRQRHELGLKHLQTYFELSQRYAGLLTEELQSA
jgi:Phosphotransferase enzyme family